MPSDYKAGIRLNFDFFRNGATYDVGPQALLVYIVTLSYVAVYRDHLKGYLSRQLANHMCSFVNADRDAIDELITFGLLQPSGDDKLYVHNWEQHLISGKVARYIPHWERLREAVFRRDNFTCQICGATDIALECDHIIPYSKGGSNELDNLQALCGPCNSRKGART